MWAAQWSHVVMDGVESPDDLREAVERLTISGSVLGKTDLDLAYKLALSLQHAMRLSTRQLIERNQNRPIMYIYMNDGWGQSVQEVNSIAAGDHLVLRRGKYRHEFIVERGLVKTCKPGGGVDISLLLAAVRALKGGRTAWHLFGAGAGFFPTLRSLRHSGPAIQLYLFDGALMAEAPAFIGRHELWYDEEHGACWAEGDDEAAELKDTDVTLSLRCRVHAAHKAVDWGSKAYQGESIVDDAHIVIILAI